jgi:hypothetical protein
MFIIAFGVVAFLIIQRNLSLARKSASWPSVDGIIVKSELVQRQRRVGGRKEKPQPDIEYTYRIKQTEYRGNQVSAGGLRVGGMAGQWVGRYPVGKQVPVHYDPKDPSVAVLEPGLPSGVQWIYVGPVIVVGVGVIGFLFPRR